MRLNKGGQVTLFIILGLVFLIAILGVVFLFRRETAVQGPNNADSVPEEFKPVSNFVEKCVHDISLDALRQMGQHGGYINPLDSELSGVSLRYDPLRPEVGELVSLTGSPDDFVPYYVHVPEKASYVNYALSTAAPSVDSMQNQMEMYIKRNLPNCTGSFSGLSSLNFEIEAANDKINPSVIIKDNQVEVFLEYPINATSEDRKLSIANFATVVVVPFKQYYDLALTISQVEAHTQFQESFTSNLIAYHSGLDRDLLPPKLATSDSPVILTWSNSAQKAKLNSLLSSYVPAIGIYSDEDSFDDEGYDSEIERAFYNSMRLRMFEKKLSQDITLFYRDNSLSMRISPSKGDLIKPNVDVSKGNQFIPADRVNSYRFSYDVTYPVFVEIRSDNEPNSELSQFSYLFAFEANIIEDKPAMAWMLGFGTAEWDPSLLQQTANIIPDNGEDFDIESITSSRSLFCNEQTWSSGNISLRVTGSGQVPLQEATVVYSCGERNECFIGETNYAGVVNSEFPVCKGGRILVSKEGYGSRTIDLSTENGVSVNLGSIELPMSKILTASVVKKQIYKQFTRDDDWLWSAGFDSLGQETQLGPNEQVVLAITEIGNQNSNFGKTILFGKDGDSSTELELAPGRYVVSASLINYDGVSVPGNCSRFCESRFLGVFGCSQYTYFPDEDIEMNPAVWGGVEIGEFTVSEYDLEAPRLQFHVLELSDLSQSSPPGACMEALDELGKIEEYSQKYAYDLRPIFTG